MRLRTCIAASATAALALPSAALAQGGVDVGGYVGGSLELILTQPKTAFTSFSSAKTYRTSFEIGTTTTVPSELSIADGEVLSGRKVGRLASGSKSLPLPLEARVGKSSFTSLGTPVAPLLTRWSGVDSNLKTKIDLRQKVTKKASGNYRKVLLVTLSTQTP